MLKVLQGTIVANKEPLIFKSAVFSAVWWRQTKQPMASLGLVGVPEVSKERL